MIRFPGTYRATFRAEFGTFLQIYQISVDLTDLFFVLAKKMCPAPVLFICLSL